MNPSIAFRSFKIKNLELKNRFVFGAAGSMNTVDEKGNLLDREIERYATIAKGGVALVETSGIGVHPRGVPSIDKALNLFRDDLIPGFKKLTDRIHHQGAKIAAQLYHYGTFAGGGFLKDKGIKAISASYLGNDPYPYKKPYFVDNYCSASDEDLHEVINAFGDAARRVKEAGFDAIVVHGCHDTLLSQFLSPITNKRDDKWGGGIENRSRFHSKIIRSIRKQVGEDFCVIIKLGVIEPYDNGLTFEDGKAAAQLLHQAGYDIIEVSQGQKGLNWEETCLRQKVNKPELEGPFRHYCKEIHQMGIPTTMIGGLRSFNIIEEILEGDETNLIGLCRPLIKEPNLVNDWESGNTHKSTCISCNKCEIAIMNGKPLACYLNDS